MDTKFDKLYEQHNAAVDAAAWDDGFVRGFKEGAGHALDFFMGWGETRNAFAPGVAEEVLSEWLKKHDEHARSF